YLDRLAQPSARIDVIVIEALFNSLRPSPFTARRISSSRPPGPDSLECVHGHRPLLFLFAAGRSEQRTPFTPARFGRGRTVPKNNPVREAPCTT
ncbi:hypothetical protein, partial [Streptomyces sp. NPDC052192]|uniref:hypothetical protein n=1 Tax=Streptomyces sp. NPDC052192 TaxID=3155052 RepID=UPI00343CDF6F